MPNYPVYQPINMVKYPDPKTMIIDWAGAINRGVKEGINLGRKIKMQNEVLRVSKVTTALKQQETESQLALQEIQRKNADFDYTRKTNALSVAAEDAQQQAQLAKSQNYIQSNYLVAGMEQFSSDPDVIRANILTKGITAKTNPIEIMKDAEELRLLHSDEGSGIAKRLELQAEYQARNPTSTLAKALTMPDGNAITALLDAKFKYETGEMVPQISTVTDEWGGTKDVVKNVKEVINYTEFSRRIKTDPNLIAKVLRESPDSAAWMKQNVSADTLKATGIESVFPGTKAEFAATQVPAATAPTAELTPLQTGEKVKFKINGKDVEVTPSLTDRLAAGMHAFPITAAIYKNSPIGKLVTPVKLAAVGVSVLNPVMQPAAANWIATGARIPEFRSLHTTAFKKENLKYFREHFEKLDAKVRNLPETATDSERQKLGLAWTQTRDYLKSLEKDYGVAEDTTVDEAAANITKGGVLTPAQINTRISILKADMAKAPEEQKAAFMQAITMLESKKR